MSRQEVSKHSVPHFGICMECVGRYCDMKGCNKESPTPSRSLGACHSSAPPRETISTQRVSLTSRPIRQLTPKCRERYHGLRIHLPLAASPALQPRQQNAAKSTHHHRPLPLPASMNSSARLRVPILVEMPQHYTRPQHLHRPRLQSKNSCDRAGRPTMVGEW